MITLDSLIPHFFNNFETQEDVDNYVGWINELHNYGDFPYKGMQTSYLDQLFEEYLVEDIGYEDGLPYIYWTTNEISEGREDV